MSEKKTSHEKPHIDMSQLNRESIIEVLNQVASEAAELYADEPLDYKGRRVTAKGVLETGQSPQYADIIIATVGCTTGKKILDVGIAYGLYDVVLKRQFGLEVSGIDHPDNIDAYCRYPADQGIPVLPCNLHFDKIPYPDNTFDTVIVSEIIEHLLIPPKVLFSGINRVLKPSGRLIVTTPNFACLRNILVLATGRNPTALFPEEISWTEKKAEDSRVHPREYTVSEVKTALMEAGFEISEIRMRMDQTKAKRSLLSRALRAMMRIMPRYRERIIAVGKKS